MHIRPAALLAICSVMFLGGPAGAESLLVVDVAPDVISQTPWGITAVGDIEPVLRLHVRGTDTDNSLDIVRLEEGAFEADFSVPLRGASWRDVSTTQQGTGFEFDLSTLSAPQVQRLINADGNDVNLSSTSFDSVDRSLNNAFIQGSISAASSDLLSGGITNLVIDLAPDSLSQTPWGVASLSEIEPVLRLHVRGTDTDADPDVVRFDEGAFRADFSVPPKGAGWQDVRTTQQGAGFEFDLPALSAPQFQRLINADGNDMALSGTGFNAFDRALNNAFIQGQIVAAEIVPAPTPPEPESLLVVDVAPNVINETPWGATSLGAIHPVLRLHVRGADTDNSLDTVRFEEGAFEADFSVALRGAGWRDISTTQQGTGFEFDLSTLSAPQVQSLLNADGNDVNLSSTSFESFDRSLNNAFIQGSISAASSDLLSGGITNLVIDLAPDSLSQTPWGVASLSEIEPVLRVHVRGTDTDADPDVVRFDEGAFRADFSVPLKGAGWRDVRTTQQGAGFEFDLPARSAPQFQRLINADGNDMALSGTGFNAFDLALNNAFIQGQINAAEVVPEPIRPAQLMAAVLALRLLRRGKRRSNRHSSRFSASRPNDAALAPSRIQVCDPSRHPVPARSLHFPV